MKKNKIQVVLPDALIERFVNEASKQNRSESNLARLYIVNGLMKDEGKKNFSDIEMDMVLNGSGTVATLKGIS